MSADARQSRERRGDATQIARNNRALLLKLGVVVVAMFGFGYALVPFYEKICEVTGLRNIDAGRHGREYAGRHDALVRIEFDTNLHNMPWKFRALQPTTDIHPGAVTQVMFEVVNTTDHAGHRPGDPELRSATGRAVFPQARLLLLLETDARSRREARHAGRVRRRSRAAEGRADDHAVVHVLRGRRHMRPGSDTHFMTSRNGCLTAF